MDQRHAAYHVAGQAVMAFYLGGWVNDEGLEINERRYCGFCFSFGHDAQAKERFLLLCDLAGWRAEHLWHGTGSSRDGYPDEELFAVLEDRRQGWDDYDGDDAELDGTGPFPDALKSQSRWSVAGATCAGMAALSQSLAVVLPYLQSN